MDDLYYLRHAYKVAAEFGTDPSTQNGALLVDRYGAILVAAANRFPAGVRETAERWERPLKYAFVEHAERNAIFSAAREGVRTEGLTMYCPWFACADCGRAIIQAGVTEVVGHDFPLHRSRPDWRKSIEVALAMFEEAGVKTRLVPGEVGGVTIRFDGKPVQP